MKHLVALVFCLFMGVTGISFGLGAVYPPLNQIAKPFVCPEGTLRPQSSVSQGRRPGQKVIQVSWACVGPARAEKPVSGLRIALYAGGIYGFGLYLVFALLSLLRRRPKPAPVA